MAADWPGTGGLALASLYVVSWPYTGHSKGAKPVLSDGVLDKYFIALLCNMVFKYDGLRDFLVLGVCVVRERKGGGVKAVLLQLIIQHIGCTRLATLP